MSDDVLTRPGWYRWLCGRCDTELDDRGVCPGCTGQREAHTTTSPIERSAAMSEECPHAGHRTEHSNGRWTCDDCGKDV